MKTLLTVPHYFDADGDGRYGSTRDQKKKRLRAVRSCLQSLNAIGHDVDIVVCTTRGRHVLDDVDLPGGSFEHRPSDAEPLMLGFECHRVVAERIGAYDFYGYVEDDLVIRDEQFFEKLQWFVDQAGPMNVLLPHRYERSKILRRKTYIDGKLAAHINPWFLTRDERLRTLEFPAPQELISDCARPAQDTRSAQVSGPRRNERPQVCESQPGLGRPSVRPGAGSGDPRTAQVQQRDEPATQGRGRIDHQPPASDVARDIICFETPQNPHSGCFFLTADQMAHWAAQPEFLNRDVSFAGPLESAATLSVGRSFHIYKPAPSQEAFLEIRHSDPRYVSRNVPGRTRRRSHPIRPAPLNCERLEQRTLLTVFGQFSNGDLEIETLSVLSGEDIIVATNPEGLVTINGGVMNDSEGNRLEVQASAVTAMEVKGGVEFSDNIDLSQVTQATFPNLVPTRFGFHIRLFVADDSVVGSPLNDRFLVLNEVGLPHNLDGNDGDDRIEVGFDNNDAGIHVVRVSNQALEFVGIGSTPISNFEEFHFEIDDDGADVIGGVSVDAAGFSGNTTLQGTNRDDTLIGGTQNDSILGADGDDFIHGNSGDDEIFGGDGEDTIAGGDGNDTILGGKADDSLSGGDGDDSISGDENNDTLDGGDKNDTLRGGADDDTILGSAGEDLLFGEAGQDSVLGGDGDDSILGGSEQDDLRGGDGSDTMMGGGADDLVVGDLGDDSLLGEDGDDTLFGDDGDDTTIGGGGNDFYSFSTRSDDVDVIDEPVGDPRDVISFFGVGVGSGLADPFFDEIAMELVANNATLAFASSPGVEVLRGTDVIDILDDKLLAGINGNDPFEVDAGPGNDLLSVGLDGTTLQGGAGNDLISIQVDAASQDRVTILDQTGKSDRLTFSRYGGPVLVDLTDLTIARRGVDNSVLAVTVASQNNFESVRGSKHDDTLLGSSADEVLDGFGGDDLLRGNGGDDMLFGQSGRDVLDGGTGNDRLNGGSGDDFLHGGSGFDEFIVGSGVNTGLDAGEVSDLAADTQIQTFDDTADPIPDGATVVYQGTVDNKGPDVATNPIVSFEGDANIAISGSVNVGTIVLFPNIPPDLPRPRALHPDAPPFPFNATGRGISTGDGFPVASVAVREKNPLPVELDTKTTVTGSGDHPINPNPNPGPKELPNGAPIRNIGGNSPNSIIDADFGGSSFHFGAIVAGTVPGLIAALSSNSVRDNIGQQANVLASTIDAAVFGDASQNRALGKGNPIRVDTNAAGAGGEGDVHDSSISDDGRFIAFTSDSALLADLPDLNDVTDVFLKDTLTQELITISKSADGLFTADASSLRAIVSPDGRFVAFHSNASNLIDGFVDNNDPTRDADVFLFDREAGTTQLVSISTNDTGARTMGANGRSRAHQFSADGRFLVFYSQASDLVPGFVDLNGIGNGQNTDLYVFDMLTQQTELVSVALDGVSGGDATVTNSFDHVSVGISDDKLLIAFEAEAKNLQDTLPDTVDDPVVFLREYPRDATTGNLLAGTTRAVSLNAAGTEVRVGRDPLLTPDGRFLAFLTNAADATDTPDSLGHNDLVLHNLETGENKLITIGHDGTTADNRTFGSQDISDDGRYVVFKSLATNLVEDFIDGNGANSDDIFVRDTRRNTTTLITLSADGVTSGNSFSGRFGITGDGQVVYYDSRASDLVLDVIDLNDNSNIFASSAHVYEQFNQPEGVGDDTLTLSRDGNDLVVNSQQNGEVSRRLLDDIAGIRIVGTRENDETLVVDFSNGAFDPGNVFFDGGISGDDSIVITGGTFDSIRYNPGTDGSGSIALSNGVNVPIVYTNAGGVRDETTATHRTFAAAVIDPVLGDPLALTIRLSDNGNSNDGFLKLDNDGGSLFKPYTIAVPTATLTVRSDEADDKIFVESLDRTFTGDLFFDGNGGDNTLTLNAISGTNVNLQLGELNSGLFEVDGRTVGFEEFAGVTDNITATTKHVGLGDTFFDQDAVVRDGTANDSTQQIASNNDGFATINFVLPAESLTISGSPQADTITVESLDATFDGALTLEGGDGRDRIDARAIDIPVTISGGADRDFLFGGQGRNRILGGDGGDRIFGNGDVDRLNGNRGADVIYGNGGRDIIRGGRSNDLLFGNSGNDLIFGNGGDDTIKSGKGNDKLFDGLGDDLLIGTSGADVYVLSARGTDTVEDSRGRNALDFRRAGQGVTVDLDLNDTPQQVTDSGALVLRGRFRDFSGSHLADTVFADFLPTLSRRLDGLREQDRVTIDAKGETVQQDGNVYSAPNFAPIELFDFEEEEFV